VLSWGTHATAIRPQALAVRLCRTALDLQDRYKALNQQPDAQDGKRGRAVRRHVGARASAPVLPGCDGAVNPV